MKFSKKRDIIFKEIINNKEHPTADTIYENLKKDYPNLSLGTVYRNLTQLEKNGYIKKITIPGSPVRYEPDLREHDHFVCVQCGKIVDVEKISADYFEKSLKDKDITILSSYTIFSGLCKECLKIKEEKVCQEN